MKKQEQCKRSKDKNQEGRITKYQQRKKKKTKKNKEQDSAALPAHMYKSCKNTPEGRKIVRNWKMLFGT